MADTGVHGRGTPVSTVRVTRVSTVVESPGSPVALRPVFEVERVRHRRKGGAIPFGCLGRSHVVPHSPDVTNRRCQATIILPAQRQLELPTTARCRGTSTT